MPQLFRPFWHLTLVHPQSPLQLFNMLHRQMCLMLLHLVRTGHQSVTYPNKSPQPEYDEYPRKRIHRLIFGYEMKCELEDERARNYKEINDVYELVEELLRSEEVYQGCEFKHECKEDHDCGPEEYVVCDVYSGVFV
eukprot:266843_1